MPVIMKQWTVGGTGITNFQHDQFPLYREAVRRYSDPNLVIVDTSYPMAPPNYGGSLHYITPTGGRCPDLSPFWQLFNQIKNGAVPSEEEDPRAAYNRAMKGVAP